MSELWPSSQIILQSEIPTLRFVREDGKATICPGDDSLSEESEIKIDGMTLEQITALCRSYNSQIISAGENAASHFKDRRYYACRLHECLGFTQTKIARLFGVNQSTVSRWLKKQLFFERVIERTERVIEGLCNTHIQDNGEGEAKEA